MKMVKRMTNKPKKKVRVESRSHRKTQVKVQARLIRLRIKQLLREKA
jgi:hypothetical protein